MNLFDFNGKSCIIEKIDVTEKLSKRLGALGICANKQIILLHKNSSGVVVFVDGVEVGICKQTASNILIKY
ncbi:MAG: FeoA domain-containing protein [Clostridia bacterium]|nr:FeoA domain-containing protein [Clostridia bacterium]